MKTMDRYGIPMLLQLMGVNCMWMSFSQAEPCFVQSPTLSLSGKRLKRMRARHAIYDLQA